jgi:hypothetical protein
MKTLFIFITLVIMDSQTKEKLTGVSVKTKDHTYYTDIYGMVNIPDSDTYNISFISYKDVNVFVKKDSAIYLKSR